MIKKIKNVLPIFFLITIWFIFSSPYFLHGRIPYPSTYQVNTNHPWSAYPQFWGPIKNAAMPDVVGQLYPWKYFTIQTLKQKELPLWNPNSFAGNPHLGNFQSAVLSPFNCLFLIFSFPDAWAMLILFQPLIAGLSMYLFMKTSRVSNVGSLISSVAFMFCGFMTVWMAYGTLSMAIAFLPLSLFAIERTFKKSTIFSIILLPVTIIFTFFSGHFQTSMYFLVLIFCFFLLKSIVAKNIKATIYVGSGLIVGVLVSLFQIIPTIIFYANSVRSEIFITQGGIPIQYLITTLSPDFYGNPVTRNDWFGYYAEFASFVGIIPLFLASFSFFNKKKQIIFFMASGLIALLLSIHTPLQGLLGSLQIPVFSTSNPNRIIVLFSFCFALLSGYGFDVLQTYIKNTQKKKIIFILSIWSIFLLAVWLLILFFHVLPDDKVIIAKRNLLLPTVFFGGSIIVVFLALTKKKFLLLVTCYLLLITSFDSLHYASKWMPFDPRNFIFQDIPVIEAIKKNIGYSRLFGNVVQDVGNYYSFQMIEGYDPLYIKRYGEFIRAAGTGNILEAERSVVNLDKTGIYTDRVLDFLGVSIIFHRIQDTNTSYAYPVWEKKQKYALLFQDKKFQLYKNKTAMQRATLFYNFEVIKDDKTLLKRFYTKDFNYQNTLLLQEQPSGSVEKGGIGYAKILLYSPNKVIIQANSNKPALLLLTDNFYPGWIVTVDGREKKIYQADYSFRAVSIPQGIHTVIFSYKLISLFTNK